MSVKTYLQEQIRLVSLSSNDLFTDEENEIYLQICELKKQLDFLDKKGALKAEKQVIIDEKKKLKEELDSKVASYPEQPRKVRLNSVLYYPKNADYPMPEGITYHDLKINKKIAEFCCELSRAMGLKHLDCTLDLIVIKWKNTDMLRQLIVQGIILPICTPAGVQDKHYRFFSASAGQLRRDKIVMISDEAWDKVHERLECGMDWRTINERGSLNQNKYMAYLALASSASEEWTDFDIDRAIVIPEFKAPVTDRMMYIKPDYTYEVGVQTVIIDHTDGSGMMLPEVCTSNFMVRGDWLKGLLGSFDFIKFCKVNNADPILTDAWGTKHDLIKERINVIFTTSQFKLYKLYKSWDEYKYFFKLRGCKFSKTNYEEDYIKDTTVNYQMLQTLVDMTDEEIKQFTQKEHDRILSLTKDKEAMLNTLKADELSEQPYKAALALYPELLREAYSRETLKDIRRRMLLDAKSGKIRCENKRLFVLPDFYACCEYWFLGIKEPKGLLAKDEIACKIFRRYNKADVLRSPHLYCEHSIQRITHDQNIYDWFYTNAIYTSCKSMISRILQFDVDGDQLNVIVDELLVDIAERNVIKYDVVPLFYDAEMAYAEPITKESLYAGLKRAHDYSNIGTISNMLTRVWNKDEPDRVVAALLTYLNNMRIDGAKTGVVHEYENYPKVAKRIGKASGGKNGRMPYFFKFSKNGRKDTPQNKKKKYCEPNDSTMNRICKAFSDIGNINMNYAGIPPFNWQMLMSGPCRSSRPEIIELFCDLDNSNIVSMIKSQDNTYHEEKQLIYNYILAGEEIAAKMIENFGPLEESYPYITKYLFAGEGATKVAHKQMFWRVYGGIALANLKENLKDCCPCNNCQGTKIPSWVKDHICLKNAKGFDRCIECGAMFEKTNSKQHRCEDCQKVYNTESKKLQQRARREKAKAIAQARISRLQSSSTET